MLALSSVPANKSILEKLPPEMFLKDPTTNLTMTGPILLMRGTARFCLLRADLRMQLSMRSGARRGMTIANQTNSVFQPPDGKGMFISAGEDADFSKGDDNLYSHER